MAETPVSSSKVGAPDGVSTTMSDGFLDLFPHRTLMQCVSAPAARYAAVVDNAEQLMPSALDDPLLPPCFTAALFQCVSIMRFLVAAALRADPATQQRYREAAADMSTLPQHHDPAIEEYSAAAAVNAPFERASWRATVERFIDPTRPLPISGDLTSAAVDHLDVALSADDETHHEMDRDEDFEIIDGLLFSIVDTMQNISHAAELCLEDAQRSHLAGTLEVTEEGTVADPNGSRAWSCLASVLPNTSNQRFWARAVGVGVFTVSGQTLVDAIVREVPHLTPRDAVVTAVQRFVAECLDLNRSGFIDVVEFGLMCPGDFHSIVEAVHEAAAAREKVRSVAVARIKRERTVGFDVATSRNKSFGGHDEHGKSQGTDCGRCRRLEAELVLERRRSSQLQPTSKRAINQGQDNVALQKRLDEAYRTIAQLQQQLGLETPSERAADHDSASAPQESRRMQRAIFERGMLGRRRDDVRAQAAAAAAASPIAGMKRELERRGEWHPDARGGRGAVTADFETMSHLAGTLL
jgi:hypothetical protein